MRDLLDVVLTPVTLIIGLLVLSLLPGLVLRVLVRLYPPDDPRRAELIAELHAVPPGHQAAWVAQQIETALLDGLPSRVRHLRRGRPARTRQRGRSAPRRQQGRTRSPQKTAEVTAMTAGAAVAVTYFFLTALFWGLGPLFAAVLPLVLMPFLPLYLLVALALHRRRRVRRALGRSAP